MILYDKNGIYTHLHSIFAALNGCACMFLRSSSLGFSGFGEGVWGLGFWVFGFGFRV